MKKRILSLCLAVLMLASLLSLFGCDFFEAFSDRVPTTYDNEEKYTVGDGTATGKVDHLSIWWIYGSVTVKTHAEDTVRIEETANGEIVEDFRLRWRYHNAPDYGDVLYIRYSASGKFDYGDLSKDLTVYLPENDGMHLSFTIEAAAVDLDVSGFENTLSSLSVSSNSGRVSARIDSADEVHISGQNDEGIPEANREFFFRARGEVDVLGISSSYAKIDAFAHRVYSGEVGTVFADLRFSTAKARDLTLQNSRGKTFATVLDFDKLEIETFDAPCELTVSPDAAFTLTMKSKDRFGHAVSPKGVTLHLAEVVKKSDSLYTVNGGGDTVTVATDSTLTVFPYEAPAVDE